MSFQEHIALMPPVIKYWIIWQGLAMVAASLLLLILKGNRRDGAIMLAAMALAFVLMQLLFNAVGFVRLLGLPHVVAWTPLAIYLTMRLRGGAFAGFRKLAVLMVLVTICISLAFDYVDVARYLMGETAPMVEPGAAA